MISKFSALLSRAIAKLRLRKCGHNCRIGPWAHIRGHSNIEIGNNFFCGPHLYLNTNSISNIRIGDDVMLGPFVKIISGNHVLDYRHGPMNSSPKKTKGHDRGITIESDVWIGTSAIILDGATISEGSVIGAGAVVSRYIPPYCIAKGNPICTTRARFSRKSLIELLAAKSSSLSIHAIDKVYDDHHIAYLSN